MNQLLKRLAASASDLNSFTRSVADSGIKSVSDIFRGTRIFGALSAASSSDIVHDETHYVLVPLPGEERKCAIYTKRILPPDTGSINSLPKLRVFHVPDVSGRERVEQELIADLVTAGAGGDAGKSGIADALESLADQIDQETSKISGGLLLIGGAVAIVNPLLGVGIAAKGLLPIIGAKASKAGAEYVGEKLRGWNQSAAEAKIRKAAVKEVMRLEPRIFSNPILRSLDVITANPAIDYDPALDSRNWVDGYESAHLYFLTQESIREVYRDLIAPMETSAYQKSHIAWIRSMMEDLPS